jgi:hypothetical protein
VLRSRYVCIGLVSAAALLFQIAQTRLFSATFGYHLTYLVISVSLLGVGSGATLSALLDGRASRPSVGALALATAASALTALFVETHIDPGTQLAAAVLVAYVAGSLPFVFASWIIVRTIRENALFAGRLYAADLGGAAAGSLLGFVCLPWLGAPGLYGASAVLAALAAMTTGRPRLRLGLPLAGTVVIAFTLSLWGDVLAPPQAGPEKSAVYGQGISHLATRWDPYARVDVVDYEGRPAGEAYGFLMDPSYVGPRPDARMMYLDLGAATPILDGAGDLSALRATIIAAPYELLAGPRVLIVGPGGGIDIQNALVHGATRVEAIEVNRGVSDLMRGGMADYSGRVYTAPGVTVLDDEARSYVMRATESYDLIVMTVVDSFAALASGSYALTESYLYTEEAFDSYLSHLSSAGVLAVGRWYREPPVEMLQTAQLAVGALRQRGVGDPGAHLLVLRYRNFGLLLARQEPFSPAAANAIRMFAREHGFEIAYDPLDRVGPFAQGLPGDTSVPATDDRPFFFANDPGDGRVPAAYAILFLALAPAIVLSYLLLLLPLRRVMGAMLATPAGLRITIQSLAVGLGFIAAEIVLLQRLTLYLGQPALALAVGLAALLVGAALGSAISARGGAGFARPAIVCAIVLLVGFVAIDRVAASTLAWSLAARAVVACLVSVAIGVPLGSVFPRVLSLAARHDERLVSWAWATNGAASVVGSILAVAGALAIGFTAVGLAAVACYVVAALVTMEGVPVARARPVPA